MPQIRAIRRPDLLDGSHPAGAYVAAELDELPEALQAAGNALAAAEILAQNPYVAMGSPPAANPYAADAANAGQHLHNPYAAVANAPAANPYAADAERAPQHPQAAVGNQAHPVHPRLHVYFEPKPGALEAPDPAPTATSAPAVPAPAAWKRNEVVKYLNLAQMTKSEIHLNESTVGGSRRFVEAMALQSFKGQPFAGTANAAAGAEALREKWGWSEEQASNAFAEGGSFRPTAVKYLLDEREREELAVAVGPQLRTGKTGEPLDTGNMFSKASGKQYGIFVMDEKGNLYVGQHQVGLFHHSSFLAGGAVAAAGELRVANGKVLTITAKSGHYAPTPVQMAQLLKEFQAKGVTLQGVELRLWLPQDPQNMIGRGDFYTATYDAAAWLAQPNMEPLKKQPMA